MKPLNKIRYAQRETGGDRDRDGGRDTDIDTEIEEICKSLQSKFCFVQEPRHPTRVLGMWEASISICWMNNNVLFILKMEEKQKCI